MWVIGETVISLWHICMEWCRCLAKHPYQPIEIYFQIYNILLRYFYGHHLWFNLVLFYQGASGVLRLWFYQDGLFLPQQLCHRPSDFGVGVIWVELTFLILSSYPMNGNMNITAQNLRVEGSLLRFLVRMFAPKNPYMSIHHSIWYNPIMPTCLQELNHPHYPL